MQSQWSKPLSIHWGNSEKVPVDFGVFEIGFLRLGWFQPKYIGKAYSKSGTGADTLRDQFQRYADESNTGARRKQHDICLEAVEFRKTHQLFFRFIVTDHPACIEARMLTRYLCGLQTRYCWNQRSERAVCKMHQENCPKRSKKRDGELTFCIEHGCACIEQPHDAEYMEADGWCMLIPHLAFLVPQETGMYQLGYLDDVGCFVPRYVNSVVRDVGTLRSKFRKYADGRGAFFDKISPFERHRPLCFAWQCVAETDTMAIACRLAAYCTEHCLCTTARDLFVNYNDWRKWCDTHLKNCQRCSPHPIAENEANSGVNVDGTDGRNESRDNQQRRSAAPSMLIPAQQQDEAEYDPDEPYVSRSTYIRSQSRRQTSNGNRSSQLG